MSAHPKEKAYRSSPFSRLIHLFVKWQTPWSLLSGQAGRQIAAAQRPFAGDAEAWKAYWQAQGQPWRTMPEIDAKRQEELTQRRTIAPDIKKGIYPYKGMTLTRADIEWLLATHENGQ